MSQSQVFDIKGIHTYSSDVSAVPSGSLSIAKNISLSRSNIAEPRRGFDILADLPDPSYRATSLFFYSSSIFAHYNNTLGLYSGGSFTSKGSITKPSNSTSIRSTANIQNLYLTSSEGIKKLDSVSGSLYAAGVPNALHCTLSLTNGANLAVVNNYDVSYRWILVKKDTNKNVLQGGASPKATISNGAGATRDVTLRCYLPSSVDNTYYAQIYRTKNVLTSVGNTGEVYQLSYEYSINSTDVSNGYFDVTDLTPDALLGADLYVSSTQQGMISNNAIPPLARDICTFKGVTFYADTEDFHRYSFTLLSCGTTNSTQFRVDDTITISNGTTTEVYTGKASENIGSKQFLVDTASASISTRIDNTVKSLINVINRASALVYATIETSSSIDLPGKVTLQGRTLGAASFTVFSSRDSAFNPNLTSPAGVNQTSSNSVYKNGLMYSKLNNPEAVPLANVFFVGSSDDRIKRIVALRDSLLIFKERDGIYRLTGDSASSFNITLLDSTAKIVGPDSLQVLNGLVYGLFESGVCEVSDSDVQIISQAIKDKILALYGTAYEAVKSYSFGVSYETDGKYILSLPETSSDTNSKYQLIYDVFGGTWVEWDLDIGCGGVNPSNNTLYLGSGSSEKIKIERKAFDYSDFADFEQNVTLSAQSGTTLTVTGIDNMAVGDLLVQGSLVPTYIQSIDLNAGTIVVDLDQEYDILTVMEHYKGVEVEIEWNRDFAGNPSGFKHYSEVSFLFKRSFLNEALLTFSSDINPGVNEITIEGPVSQSVWGYDAWDDGVWGGLSVAEPIRVGVPGTSSRCNSLTVKLNHSVAFSDFQLSGMSLVFNPTSTRTNR